MPQATTARRTLNRSELAAHHGISLPTVDSWVRRGCPAIERGSKGSNWKFDPVAVIEWRLKDAVEETIARFVTGDGDMSREEADRRRAVANAKVAEIELDDRLKSVVSVQHVNDDVTTFCNVLHIAMDNASHKIADRTSSITSAPEIREVCRSELNRALTGAKTALTEKWTKGA